MPTDEGKHIHERPIAKMLLTKTITDYKELIFKAKSINCSKYLISCTNGVIVSRSIKFMK